MTVTVNPRYLNKNKAQVQKLLDEVENRSFFVDMTEDEYEALPAEDKMNGDLYLLHEEDDDSGV